MDKFRTEWVSVVSCEHGGNKIPSAYTELFKGAEVVLNSHRGYDLGALSLYNEMLDSHDVSFGLFTEVSRLLVDINRSTYRRTLFSEFTKLLSKAEKQEILENYYHTFRLQFKSEVTRLWTAGKKVLHLSVHSFTPELHGKIRETDFGILYHPGREQEVRFAKLWKAAINKVLPGYRVRYNYPFKGKPDGHVRAFRDMETVCYAGIEIEMNQRFADNKEVHQRLADSYAMAFEEFKKS